MLTLVAVMLLVLRVLMLQALAVVMLHTSVAVMLQGLVDLILSSTSSVNAGVVLLRIVCFSQLYLKLVNFVTSRYTSKARS